MLKKEKNILTVYVGEDNFEDWALGIGKEIMFPELLKGCEKLLYNDLKEVFCLRLTGSINNEFTSVDLTVHPVGVSDTLEKMLEWAVENEEYEMCSRIKKLQEHITA